MKNPHAVAMGRRRKANLTPEQRQAEASAGGSAWWSRLNPKERREHVARLNAARLEKLAAKKSNEVA